MPSRSEKQRRFMLAAIHDKKFADKAGIPQSVAKEFVEADKNLVRKPVKEMMKKRYGK